MKKLISKVFGTKSFRAGGYSAAAVAIIVAIAVAVNLVVSALPTTKTELDFTENNIYSLSDQTKRIVTSLDKDVTLYLLATTGNEDSYITGLLERYKDLSSHIKIETVDPVEYPTFASAYTSETVYQNSVIAVCGDRSRYVSYYDIYEQVESEYYDTYYYYVYYYGYTQYYDYLYDWVFSGENAFTSAISYVTSETLPMAYFLTGHGEDEWSESLLASLEADNFAYDTFNFIHEEGVPEDADIVIINYPENDISSDEADALISYLDEGGNIVMCLQYVQDDALENINRVMNYMGMNLVEGIVIEGNSDNYYRYPYTMLPNIGSHEITSALVSDGAYIIYPIAMGIEHTEDIGTYTALLTSSDEAFSKVAGYGMNTYEKEEGDLEGPFDLAACVKDGQAHMAVFTSAQFVNDSANQLVSGSNYDLLLNSLSWMVDMEDKISIRYKSLESSTLTVSAADRNTWSIVLIGVIPATLILIGVVIMIRRKHR